MADEPAEPVDLEDDDQGLLEPPEDEGSLPVDLPEELDDPGEVGP